MKKFLGLILSAVMLFQTVGTGIVMAEGETSEADTVDTASAAKQQMREDINEEISLLTYTGVIDFEYDFDPDVTVTRATFATYAAAMINANEEMSISYFTDVPMNYWASDSINALVDRKIIDKASDGMFEPDRDITYAEACKIMASATGYKVYADPDKIMNEYIQVAGRAGFGITPASREKITVAEAIQLVYNTMRTDLMTVVGVDGETYTVKPDEGENVFSVYHNIRFDDGRIESIFGKTVSSDNASAGYVYINGKECALDEEMNLDEFFGRTVNYAYVYNKSEDLKTIIYAEAKYDNDYLKVMYDDIVDFDEPSHTLRYYLENDDSGRIKSKSAVKNVDVIYNGRPYGKELKPQIAELIGGVKKGTVEYISSVGNSASDLIVVTAYEVYGKDSYNSSFKKFYSEDGNSGYNIDDYENYVIYDITGSQLKNDALSEGPYMIMASEDKEYLAIIVCSRKVEGKIDGIKAGKREITIGDTVYLVDKAFWETDSYKFTVGASYTLYTDIYNEVIDLEITAASGMKIGYITNTALSDDIFAKKILIKMYSADDNTLNIYELADKVTIDEIKYDADNYKDVAVAFPGNTTLNGNELSIARQAIRYTLDKDGKIDKIDTRNITANEDKETTLHRTTDGIESLVYTYNTSCLGMSQYIDRSNIKYLVVPNTDENGDIVVNGQIVEDDISQYSNTYSIEDWKTYNVELFKYSPDTLGNDLVLIYSDAKVVDYNLIMYGETTEGLDDDGETSKVLTGYSMGAEVNLPVDSTINLDDYDLEKGDIVYVDFDRKKKNILSVTKMYDAATNKFEDYGSLKDPDRYWYGGTYANEAAGTYRGIYYQISRGYALDSKGKLTSISYTLPLAYEGKASEVITTSSIPVTIYDKSKDKNQMYSGSASDILTYKKAGADCDLVLVNAKQSSRLQIFIIRD